MQSTVELNRVLTALASLKLTLFALAGLAIGIAALYLTNQLSSATLALPLGVLAINLLAAIITNRTFRRQTSLLIFHLALLVLLILLLTGRLTYLTGATELADGEEFSGQFVELNAGPLHSMEAFRRLRFTNLGFRISYAPGPLRQEIRNLVQVGGAGETSHRIELTDHAPMILNGYRFYPTGNKGFAPTFSWLPAKNSAETIGSVNLPSYPLHEHEQSREWTPPGSSQHLWIMLQFDELILDPQRPSEFRLPSRHSLVLRAGERRYVLVPGDVVEFPEGRLTYLGLRGWMGYAIFFDWTIPWLLAACLVAVGALSTHYWRKFAAKPWNA